MNERERLRTEFEPSFMLYPFEHRWFDGPHGRTHYVDEGEGRPLLLVHGNPTWSFLYRRMIPLLVERGYRCIAPDLLGYGLSEHPSCICTAAVQADTLTALIISLDLSDTIIVGQDWGGPIGLGAAVAVPERIGGLVLGSTFAWKTDGVVRLIARVLRAGPTQRWMIDGSSFIGWVLRQLTQRTLCAEELDHYCGVAARPELRRSKAVLPRELIDADDWLEQLERRIGERLRTKPALLLHPTKEGALGRAAVKRFGTLLDDHRHVDIPGAGHFFQEDAPNEAVDAIVDRFAQ